jgi:peptidoglycan/LPS O-acetylase OafA/YrhL
MMRQGRFALGRFFERRARRILPALTVVTAATLAAGWFLLLPDEYAELGRSAAAQPVLATNVYFARTIDYFTSSAAHRPLLHTWSLSIEGQFYLAIPFLLLGLWRASRRRPALAPFAIALLVAASFAWSVRGVARAEPAAFYLLPPRAWELLLGSLTALVPARALAARCMLREAIGWLGLAMVVVPILAYDESTPFPGLAALPPCLGTALVLWSTATTPTTVGRVLSVRPLVLVGLLSYSLYLWHWPLLAFARVRALAPPSVAERAALLVVALLLATLSWRLVERPFRARRVARTSRAFATWASAALAATLVGGSTIGFTGGAPGRFAPQTLQPLAARQDRAFLRDVSLDEVQRGELVRFGSDDPDAAPELLVWGDSHAMAALPAFDALLKERGRAGIAATHVATAPLLGFVLERRTRTGLHGAAPRYADAVLRYVRERGVRDVVLIANWSGYRSDGDGPSAARLEEALVATVGAVVRSGARAWVLLQIPAQPFDVPATLAWTFGSGVDPAAAAGAPDGSNGITGSSDPRVVQRIVAAGGRIVDPRPDFLDATGRRFVLTVEGSPAYVDRHHLTATGARRLLLPLLRETFD